MKKRVQFILAFIAVVSVAFTSCKKNDDTNSGGGSIVGKWEGVTAVVKATIDGQQQSETDTFQPGEYVIEFKADKTYTETGTAGGKYSISGNKVTMTDAAGDTVYEYLISGSTLTLKTTGTMSEGGVSFSFEATATFKKQ